MPDTVALVSCVKSKAPGARPAQDLYVSALFRKMRKYAEANADRWFVLSALHGLVEPITPLEPYEVTLNGASRAVRREWSRKVFLQMQDRDLVVPGQRMIWLAGQNYIADLRPLLNSCEHVEPMKGMPIGRRLQWLTEQAAV
ncbi:MAG: hypothetical protein ACI89L_002611 [Phycisphaerales bacterium]|jgi:hypothetical protein